MILLDYWPLGRLQSRKIVTNMPEVMPVSTNQGKQKNKSEKEALKKNIFPPNNQKLSETKIAGIIPRWQLKEKIPFFVLSAVMVIITLYTPDNHNNPDMLDVPYFKQFPLISRFANASVAFVTYLEKTFWPHDMAIFYPFSDQIPLWQVLGASLLILVISVVIIVMIKRLPYLFTGWMWYAITIAPVIGIIQVSKKAPYAMADRYHYLPSIGLAVMMAWGIPALIKSEAIRKKILFPAGIIFLAILSFLSWSQCRYWKDSITLFNHTLKVTDHNWLAYNNKGVTYYELGDYKQAIEDYSRAIELNPDYTEAFNNRGTAYYELGNYRQAIEDYDRLIGFKPGYGDAYLNRGVAYAHLGDYRQAIEDFNKVVEINPGHAKVYNNRGNAYFALGNHRQAIEDYGRAIEIDPGYAEAYNNRALVYLNQEDNISGCHDARKTCELGNCKLLEMAKGKGDCR
jgi:tetratricopeptide (TPR) repeat protein